jgi:hypothetical protein
MKNPTAHDWEDMLQVCSIASFTNNYTKQNYTCQCAIPAFEQLLPEQDNMQFLDLLFVFASWHSLAKLRLHTDDTLKLLDEITSLLGERLRNFRDGVCTHYATHELPKEEINQKRREIQKGTANQEQSVNTSVNNANAPTNASLSGSDPNLQAERDVQDAYVASANGQNETGK